MSAKNDWLLKKIEEMPEDQRTDLLADILGGDENTLNQVELELLSSFDDVAIEKFKNFGKMQGMSSGYPKIDHLTKGLVGGELTVLAGETSHGKTTMAINIANNVALQDAPVLFVTLEMTQAEIASRYMQINGGNNTEAYSKASNLTLLQSSDKLNWRNIDSLIENAVSGMGVKLVVIDHLHYFTRELENVAEDLGRITKELKKNAIRHNVPVILISHVRRLQKQSSSATIDDLRGSSYIAQDADIVLMVGRVRTAPNRVIVKIQKNRNRGFDYNNDEAILYLDKIKIYNSEADAVFKPEATSPVEQPTEKVVPLF